MVTLLSTGSAVLALLAAVLWWMSARVDLPYKFNVHVVKPHQAPMGQPLGGIYVGHAYSEEFIQLSDGLSKQSRLSAWAAIAAGLSALSQSIATIIALVQGP